MKGGATHMDIITLLNGLLEKLFKIEETFYQTPSDLYSVEQLTADTFTKTSADFLGMLLSEADQTISKSQYRKNNYTIQRHDSRTLTTLVGDVVFNHTMYKKKEDKSTHFLLDEMLQLDCHERFSEGAEVALLTEAVKSSYSKAAKILPTESEVSKTTVMNKVHQIAEEVPLEEKETLKKCEYLYIEADEDHISEQGRTVTEDEDNKMLGKLAYLYESKKEIGKNKRELVNTFYQSGVYEGSEKNQQFWKRMEEYIEKTYDMDYLKTVYVIGDGAGWIKSAENQVVYCKLCMDKYHVAKYINSAANQMMDEKDIAKENIYKYIYGHKKKELTEYFDEMLLSANNQKPVEDAKNYLLNNWPALMRTYHDKNLYGSSTEGHVSNVLSARMSSRPMAWSNTGADRMCKLRCYVENHGEEKLINLVRYSREKRNLKRTGTEDIPLQKEKIRMSITEKYDKGKSYIESIQATIPGYTARKQTSIRHHLNLI